MPQMQMRANLPDMPAAPVKRLLSEKQFQAEADYYRATVILEKLLQKGLITHAEFSKIDKLNRQSISPQLASIMP